MDQVTHFRSSKKERWANWPQRPDILGTLETWSQLPTVQRDPGKYHPTLIIGLGQTGEHVLRQLLAELARDPAGPQKDLRAILVTAAPVPLPLEAGLATVQHFDLATNAAAPPTWIGPRSKREEMHLRFRQPAGLQRFREQLANNLNALQSGIRVFVLAGAQEFEVGVLGDILQVLRLMQARCDDENLLQGITALISLSDSGSESDGDQVPAVLREIGRFTTDGWHWMEAIPGTTCNLVDRALLDQVFLLEDERPPSLTQRASFGRTEQAMAETLFTLLQPAAAPLWEQAAEDAQQAATIRRQRHQAVINSLNVATLRFPRREIQHYLAGRIAQAALFGTQQGRPAADPRPAERQAEQVARGWLTTDSCAPYLFDWLLEADGPLYFDSLPRLSDAFQEVFSVQLAKNLATLLNAGGWPGRLDLARDALDWLHNLLVRLDGWLNDAPVHDRAATERVTLQHLFGYWRAVIDNLGQQLDDWIAALSPAGATIVESPLHGQSPERGASSSIQPQASPEEVASRGQRSLCAALQETVAHAQKGLDTAGDRVSQVAAGHEIKDTGSSDGPLVPPDLARRTLASDQFLQAVRERLNWWIHLQPGRPPEISLRCLPGTLSGQDHSDEALYSPGDVNGLARAVIELARSCVELATADLPSAGQLLARHRPSSFLAETHAPLLRYDLKLATYRCQPPVQRAYLVAKDANTAGRYLAKAFPDLAPSEVSTLTTGDATRLTSLRFWVNVPLETVLAAHCGHRQYCHQQDIYLYPQERGAALYEQRLHARYGSYEPLPPELCLALIDPQLVSLFFQALFCGLVHPEQQNNGSYWTLAALGEDLEPLALALADDPRGLWRALRRFALELPGGPVTYRGPGRRFFGRNRQRFLSTLQAAIRQRCNAPEIGGSHRIFVENLLADWQTRGQLNLFDRAFASLLMLELDEPHWRDDITPPSHVPAGGNTWVSLGQCLAARLSAIPRPPARSGFAPGR